jgi:hypothetical protein
MTLSTAEFMRRFLSTRPARGFPQGAPLRPAAPRQQGKAQTITGRAESICRKRY